MYAIVISMKSNENKLQVKSARKAAAENIKTSLVTALNNTAEKLGQNYEQIQKAAEKGLTRLAKKLSREMEFVPSAVHETVNSNNAAGTTEKQDFKAKNKKKRSIAKEVTSPVKKKHGKEKAISKSLAKEAKPA